MQMLDGEDIARRPVRRVEPLVTGAWRIPPWLV